MCVMVDQREALTVSSGLTDTLYLVRPFGIQTVNPWVRKQQPRILPISYLELDIWPPLCQVPSYSQYNMHNYLTPRLKTDRYHLTPGPLYVTYGRLCVR